MVTLMKLVLGAEFLVAARNLLLAEKDWSRIGPASGSNSILKRLILDLRAGLLLPWVACCDRLPE